MHVCYTERKQLLTGFFLPLILFHACQFCFDDRIKIDYMVHVREMDFLHYIIMFFPSTIWHA